MCTGNMFTSNVSSCMPDTAVNADFSGAATAYRITSDSEEGKRAIASMPEVDQTPSRSTKSIQMLKKS